MHRSHSVRSTFGPCRARRARTVVLALALLTLCTFALPLAARGSEVGPPIAGIWRNLGPDGGTIHKVAVHPGDPAIVYAAGGGGIFRSGDGGATRAPVNRGLSLHPELSTQVTVVDLEIDRTHPSTLYAAIRADGIARSTDGGATWSHVDAGLHPRLESIALDPTNGQRLFAATGSGLFRSGDGGASWRKLTRGLPATPPARAEIVTIDPAAPQTAYAVFQEGSGNARRVYKTTNGGAAWRSISTGPLAGRFVAALEVDPLAPSTLYAACRPGLFVSTDGGATWRARGLATDNVFSLLFHPARRGTVYAGTWTGVRRTADGGAHWEVVSPTFTDLSVYSLAFSPSTPRTLFAGTSLGSFGNRTGGVFKSTDAALSWRFSSAGIKALSTNVFAIDPKNSSIFWLVTDAGFYKSRDWGATWTRLAFESHCAPFGPHSLALDPERPENAYMTVNGQRADGYGVCVTRDGGATWTQTLTTPDRLSEVQVDPLDPSILYAAGKGMWKSSDQGTTWSRIPGLPASYEIFDLPIAERAPGAVYAVGWLPHPSTLFEVLRSTDGGATWRNLGTPSLSGSFQSLALDPFDSRTLYSAERGTLRKSVDQGDHWPIVSDAFFPRAGLVQASKSVPGRVHFAAQGGMVYASEDGGTTWRPLGNGPDFIVFDSFLVDDPSDPRRLYVGASGGPLLEFTREP